MAGPKDDLNKSLEQLGKEIAKNNKELGDAKKASGASKEERKAFFEQMAKLQQECLKKQLIADNEKRRKEIKDNLVEKKGMTEAAAEAMSKTMGRAEEKAAAKRLERDKTFSGRMLNSITGAFSKQPKDKKSAEDKMEEKRADQKRTGLLMRLVGGLGKTAGKGGLGLMGFFKKFIGGKLKLILMGIAGGLMVLFSQLKLSEVKKMWESFKKAIIAIYDFLAPIVKAIWKWSKDTLLPTLVDFFMDSMKSIKKLFTDLKERFSGWGQMSFKEKVLSVLGAFEDIGSFVFDMITNLMVGVEKLLGGDGTFMKDTMGEFKLWLTNIWEWIKLLFTDPKKALQQAWDKLLAGVKSIGKWIMKNWIDPLWNKITGWFSWDDGDKDLDDKSAKDKLWGGFKSMMKSIYGFFRKIFNLDYVGMAVSLAKKSGEAGKWLLGEMGLIPGVESAKERLAREAREAAVGTQTAQAEADRQAESEQLIKDAQAGKGEAGEIIRKRRTNEQQIEEADRKIANLNAQLERSRKAFQMGKMTAKSVKAQADIIAELKTQKEVKEFLEKGQAAIEAEGKKVIVTPQRSALQQQLMRDEGFKPKVYKDTRGIDTVGIGFNLEKKGAQKSLDEAGINKSVADLRSGKASLTQEEAQKLMMGEIPYFRSVAEKYVGSATWKKLPPSKRNALTNLAFNLGPKKLELFSKLKKAIQDENWDEAENQLLYNEKGETSKYASQVKGRATRIAALLNPNDKIGAMNDGVKGMQGAEGGKGKTIVVTDASKKITNTNKQNLNYNPDGSTRNGKTSGAVPEWYANPSYG